MKDDQKQDLLQALFRFKKASIALFRSVSDADGLSAPELSALGCIGGCKKGYRADHTTHHAMHETLAVSKAAVSQMLGSLEKRGYIRREIDRENRRKIIITLTEQGKSAVDEGQGRMDTVMARIVQRLGAEEAEQFVRLLTRFTQIVEEENGARMDNG
jgi:DNA-binding MarR family transcriptional regulator